MRLGKSRCDETLTTPVSSPSLADTLITHRFARIASIPGRACRPPSSIPADKGNMPPDESIGERIRRLRKHRGFSQDKLAIDARVDQSGLSKFERGRERSMSLDALGRIAVALGITLEVLLRETGKDPDSKPDKH
jgi:ribosome-binding protein aMBF1 (putative translation factor)